MFSIILFQQSVPDISKFTEVIKSVTDPFSLLALIVLVLAILGYRAIDQEQKWFRLLSLSIVIVALVTLALNATRQINAKTTGQPERPAKEELFATVVFKGARQGKEPLTVPFQITSGQVNFGCTDSARPSVSYSLPSGAREVNASAAWVNTDNVKSQTQEAVVAGTVVTASGTIVGLDRDWIGNCRGGGHGELLLRGTYVIDQLGAPQPITKSERLSVASGSQSTIDLPFEANVVTKTCEITVASQKSQYGGVVLSINGEKAETLEKEGRVDARLDNGKIVLSVE